MNVRRRDKRIWFVVLGVFVAAFLFTFLTQKFKDNEAADAASLANFDPGYIISDYQMGNYNSMSEAEIQKFLTSKNPCSNTNYSYYQQLSANKSYTWHWANGHFVCLSEERFGDGETIGSGDTAAHIIWQAAQDYKINPQVLIVLLQKETGLITDPIPNNGDYRKATGYGCPDTAACSSKYYGFKNQVRNAAALFRTVLDGGWTNYPLGNNYIQYNPNAACGGSVVNIRSLATSALYRYTPYQPNAGALAAGYGTASCGAYGNRNFYLYFEDWFGGITGTVWENMITPRVMKVTQDTLKVNPSMLSTYNEWVRAGYKFYFASKIDIFWGGEKRICLRTLEDTNNNINRCILMNRMEETDEPLYDLVNNDETSLLIRSDTYKYDLKTGAKVQQLRADDYYGVRFGAKVVYNGVEYYRTSHDIKNGIEAFVLAEKLKKIEYKDFIYPRYMIAQRDVSFVNLRSGEVCKNIKSGYINKFTTKINIGNKTFYRTLDDLNNDCAINSDALGEVNVVTTDSANFKNFLYPRSLKIIKNGYSFDVVTGKSCKEYNITGTTKKFVTKVNIKDEVYYRDDKSTASGSYCAINSKNVKEL